MADSGCNARKYFFTLVLGAVAGGIFTAYVTKAMPKIMAGMMRNMMSEMGGEGCTPSEM